MTEQQAKIFTKDIFDLIKQSKAILDLEKIPDELNIPIKNRMNTNGYPKIEFEIRPEEIKTLINTNILNKELGFSEDVTSRLNDPLSKLLYATAWKNGDLKKIRHIVKGIMDTENGNNDQDHALVFYQFGKYLTKTSGQPIIDQHVIRAFAIYRTADIEKILSLQKIEILDKSHKQIISDYKKWLTSDELTAELRNEKDYTYQVDKLLFATGKTIKFQRMNDKKSKVANQGP